MENKNIKLYKMKRVVNFWMALMLLSVSAATAQKTSDDRMARDLAVTESVLNTLLKNEFDQRNFFFMDVKGNYIPGYGVTFIVPTSILNTSIFSGGGSGNVVYIDGTISGYSPRWAQRQMEEAQREMQLAEAEMERATREAMNQREGRSKTPVKATEDVKKKKATEDQVAVEMDRRTQGYGTTNSIAGVQTYPANRKKINADSLQAVSNEKVINVAKNFIMDYGDMLGTLTADERIVVTNRGNNQFTFFGQSQNSNKALVSVEARKGDLTDFRQGKITRDQMLAKLKVVNSVSTNKVEPDMELLASIFNRLYRSDLSKTFFTQGNVYYERLTDFGAIVYIQVYSSNANNVSNPWGRVDERDMRLSMPTVGLENLTQQERDKKVKELYPLFESELKENILDYGRTLKSLNDTEQLIVNVTVTKCVDCGIPATLEMAVKASVLKDYNAGKVDKSSALSKIEVKRGAAQ